MATSRSRSRRFLSGRLLAAPLLALLGAGPAEAVPIDVQYELSGDIRFEYGGSVALAGSATIRYFRNSGTPPSSPGALVGSAQIMTFHMNVGQIVTFWSDPGPGNVRGTPQFTAGTQSMGTLVASGGLLQLPLFASDSVHLSGVDDYYDPIRVTVNLAIATLLADGAAMPRTRGHTLSFDLDFLNDQDDVRDGTIRMSEISRGQVPEPNTFALVSLGLAILGGASWQRRLAGRASLHGP